MDDIFIQPEDIGPSVEEPEDSSSLEPDSDSDSDADASM
jgi:hypothetical protein